MALMLIIRTFITHSRKFLISLSLSMRVHQSNDELKVFIESMKFHIIKNLINNPSHNFTVACNIFLKY